MRLWKLLLISFASFSVGVGSTLVLAYVSSGHWVSLSYVFKAADLRMDAGEAAAAGDWREVDRTFAAVSKIKGTKGSNWFWAWPLVAWIDVDYTRGPAPSYSEEDLAIPAYAAMQLGDNERAEALYARLETVKPGKSHSYWERVARASLKHFEESADIVRRGKVPKSLEGRFNPPSPSPTP